MEKIILTESERRILDHNGCYPVEPLITKINEIVDWINLHK